MEGLHDRGPTVLIVTLVLMILATVFTILRLISKWGVTRNATADDYAALIAWAFAVGLSVAIIVGTTVGLGAPDSQIPPSWVLPLERSIYAFTVLYHPALMAIKAAILILYYRVATAHPFFRRASLITLAVVSVAGIVLTFLCIFQCRPVSAAFNDVAGKCIDLVSLYLSSAPISVLTDLAILILPLPFLTSLRMVVREKVILVATFVMGGFVTIVDVVRIAYLQAVLKEERRVNQLGSFTAINRSPNSSYYLSFSLMWSAVEISVGIICCCILVLKPLVLRVTPKYFGRKTPQQTTTPQWLLKSDFQNRPLDAAQPESPLSPPLSTELSPCYLQNTTSPSARSFPGVDGYQSPASAPQSTELSPHQLQGSTSPSTRSFREVDGSQSPTSVPMRPLPEHIHEDIKSGEVLDFFEMLATAPPQTYPLSGSLPANARSRQLCVQRRPTILERRRETLQTESTQAPPQNFMDFVNIQSKKPLTQLSAKEAWWPIMFVSFLFFLWGFARGIISSLNGEIQALLGFSTPETLALSNGYWAAYFFGPLLVGYWVLKYGGFKPTFITGLAIYATGAMAFWPSSVLHSYPGFFVSNFFIPLGLSCLEIAANSFIALAGPGELSEARLNFAQGFQGIGSIISPLIATKALFSGIDQEDLYRLQWCYLAVALFVTLLGLVFFYVPLSEASDADLDLMATQRLRNADLDVGVKSLGLNTRKLVLWTGVFSMFTYSGARQTLDSYFNVLVGEVKPGSDQFRDFLISRGIFTFGRFLSAGFAYAGVPPRIFLGVFDLGAFFSSLLVVVLPQGSGALSMLLLNVFFQSTMFPTLFAMTLRGQGRHTKFAAAALTMAISGAAAWQGVAYAIGRYHPGVPRYAMVLAVVLFGVLLLWPVLTSLTQVLRKWVDPVWSKRVSREGGPGSIRTTTALANDKGFRSQHEVDYPGV